MFKKWNKHNLLWSLGTDTLIQITSKFKASANSELGYDFRKILVRQGQENNEAAKLKNIV